MRDIGRPGTHVSIQMCRRRVALRSRVFLCQRVPEVDVFLKHK